jgi:large subunit ribosomal protein L29
VKPKDVRRRSANDLHEEVKRLEKLVFDSRFKGQTEEKTDRGLVRRTRREVARIHTILRERELGLSPEPAASSKAGAAKERE